MYISKRSGMDHTVLPANTPCLPFLRKRSPYGATSNWGKRHLIAAYYSSIDPEGTKGWVGLVGWHWGNWHPVSYRSSAGQGKFAGQRKTNVLPLCHATNQADSDEIVFVRQLTHDAQMGGVWELMVSCRQCCGTAAVELAITWVINTSCCERAPVPRVDMCTSGLTGRCVCDVITWPRWRMTTTRSQLL